MIKPLQKRWGLLNLWMILMLALSLSACKTGFDKYWKGENPKGGFLYNKIKDNPEFSIFAQGLQRANLVQYIDQGGLYTVFAPTNEAFYKYLHNHNYASIEAVPVDSLFKVLSFHIVNNMWYYYDFRSRYIGPYKQKLYLTRNKKFVDIDVSVENTIKINGVAVLPNLRDIDAENGVIHGIGEVLVPLPNLEELMQSDPEISNSTFYKLLQVTADRQFDRFNSYDKDRDGRIDSVFYKTYPLIDRLLTSLEFRQNQNVDSQGGDPVFTTILMPGNTVFDPYIAPVLAKFGGKIENLSPSYAEEVLENYILSDTLMNSAAITTRTGVLRTVNQETFTTNMLRN
ncbi:MAG: fasciclin domain-containing protein, partial [Sphingobacteriaceae bacterium]